MFDNQRNPIPVLSLVVLFFLSFSLQTALAESRNIHAGRLYTTDTTSAPDIEGYVTGVFEKIKEGNHYVNNVSEEDMGSLPVGLVREINGKVYVIAIDSARITPQGAYFSAYFRFPFPGTNSELIFGGKNIGFTPGGIAMTASTKLVLLKEKKIGINDHLDLIFPGDGSNYVEWNCNGFNAANLSGVFEFDTTWLQPVDSASEKLRAGLQVNVHDLNNILATIDIPAFRISKLKDFSFKVKNAVVDMSDTENPTGMNVTSDMLDDPSDKLLWRGFYLQEIEVGLPSQLATKKGRPEVSVHDFIIDDHGVSGTVTAENIVKLGDASAGGWPLSVDKVGLTFHQNKLSGGVLGGKMQMDFLGEDTLKYDASINMRGDDTYYSFAVKTTKEKKYKFFGGEITLDENSGIASSKTENDFLPVATLNGKVTLNKSVLNVKDITFQELTISTQKPYVHSGTFQISNEDSSKMGGFPIGIDSLKIGISEGKIAIGATVRLNFMNSSDKGFSGSTSFIVSAANEEEVQTVIVNNTPVQKTRTHWKLDKVKINDINLAVKVMAFQMKGSLSLFDDHPVYGNGFRGSLEFAIPGPIPKAKATAYFGSKDDYRYWHADVYIGVRLPIPPMLQITGMMGGMSYHMERPSDFDPYDQRNAIDQKGGLPKELDEIFKYVPSKEAGLGFMGGVSLALFEEMIMNANAMLEVQFGTNGGLRYAQFDGAGYLLHKAEKAPNEDAAREDASAPIWTQFKMRYDNTNSTFDANMKTYINIAGVLRGSYERGLVGEAALHIAPDDWWFYVGRPSAMYGLTVLGLADIKSYFMMGSHVEDMPPPPPEVNEVIDDLNNNFMTVENAMGNGSGLGFGAHFRSGFVFDYGVYGEFAIGAGSDILLRNYGDATCKGSNSVIGFNGWYASGQAYAFLKGDVGLRVKVFGKKRAFSIAKLAAAVLLQAKMPNPSWFKGTVAVKYSVLGGMVKGTAKIKVELGTQCEIVGAKELNIQVISDVKPDDQTTDVSVFATPQVAFNIAVAKPFSMMNEYDEVATYRVRLADLKLSNGTQTINGDVDINPDGMSAALTLRDILPPSSKLTAAARVYIERQNGVVWDALKNDKKEIDYETKSATFTTGEAPLNIPWENVAYAYPVRSQYNLYPKEYGKGYIKLKRGQPYLFATVDDKGKKWKIDAAINTAQGQSTGINVTYDVAQAQVNFDIPATMPKATVHTFGIVRSSLDGEAAVNNTVKNEQTDTNDGDTTTLTQTNLKGNAVAAATKDIIRYSFRTSKYSTFTEKMNAATDQLDLYDVATNYISVIGKQFSMDETFDKFEIEGDGTFATKPLIALKAGLNNKWLQEKILPIMYNGYPFEPSMKLDRDPLLTDGIPPLEAVRLYNNDHSLYKLEETAVTDGFAMSNPGYCRFMYYVSFTANLDYRELAAKAFRLYSNTGDAPAPIRTILTTPFPDMMGNIYYPVDIQYRLPGTNHITSSVTRSIYYKL